MDFFGQQDKARRNSGYLIFLFCCAVLLTVAAITAAIVFLLERSAEVPSTEETVGIAGLVLFVLVAISVGKSVLIASRGGEGIAESLGGTEVIDPSDPLEKRYRNVVEEMSLAAGVEVPRIYVLNHELHINAFAAGTSTKDAVIGVTRGCLEQLSRDELQGVIAHEFSHIFHGDSKINLRLIGVLFGLMFLVQIGRMFLYGGRSKEGRGLAVVGIVVVLVGLVGYFFGTVIKAALSRQREFLADASAVQYTRNPSGIANALAKIGQVGSVVEGKKVSEASHMFIAQGFFGFLDKIYSTHPPIESRLEALGHVAVGTPTSAKPTRHTSVPSDSMSPEMGFSSRVTKTFDPNEQIKEIGEVSGESIKLAHELLEAIPTVIREELHNSFGARCCLFAILLGHAKDKQIAIIKESVTPETFSLFNRLFPIVSSLGPEARISLIDLATPALRRMSSQQCEVFLGTCTKLALADDVVELGEYILVKIIHTNLDDKYRPTASKQSMSQAMAKYVVLSAVADYGHPNDSKRDMAYVKGAEFLRLRSLKRTEWNVSSFDAAIRHLNRMPFHHRQNFLEAVGCVIKADGKVLIAEAELMRGIVDLLGCPHPFQPA
jgi:Zn-dependent protease with chaperone function